MHCLQPACVTACLVGAMEKKKDGPVVCNEEKCIGCRYCMVACPFSVPKFEFQRAVPSIRKCTFCFDRLMKGEMPACVESCPVEALKFGKRKDLLEEARCRICSEPDKYLHQVYGEHEVGGTSWLYLSSVPFNKIGFRSDLGKKPYPELTAEFIHVEMPIYSLYTAFSLGIYYLIKGRERKSEEEGKDK